MAFVHLQIGNPVMGTGVPRVTDFCADHMAGMRWCQAEIVLCQSRALGWRGRHREGGG